MTTRFVLHSRSIIVERPPRLPYPGTLFAYDRPAKAQPSLGHNLTLLLLQCNMDTIPGRATRSIP